jgi:hypothetical protein
MTSKDKIQHMLITHLLKEGSIEIALPQGMQLALGLTNEGKHGTEIRNDYFWMTAMKDDKKISFDNYNLELEYSSDRLVFNSDEENIHMLEVV